VLTSARPGIAEHTRDWIAAADEAVALADQSGEDGLRVAVRGAAAYAQMCAGDLDRLEAAVDEMLEIGGGDQDTGAGIVIGSPIPWALMGKSVALRERGRPEEAERLLDEAVRQASERDDPEMESWSLGTKAIVLVDRGEIEAALALALRNCELTERLGDVFSRSMALNSLSYVRLEAGEFAGALEAVELADRGYREAMGTGGETEGWRGVLRARALLGLGRVEEALAQAEWAAETARRRGMDWQLPPALHTLARARAAAGAPGVAEALDEATAVAENRGQETVLRQIETDRAALTTA
jgi:tetratricopeptide (TPR) repeat protein